MDQLVGDIFVPFSTKGKSPPITHLCYADDTILFISGEHTSTAMMMHKFGVYENISKQLVNKRKSGFVVHTNTANTFIQEVK